MLFTNSLLGAIPPRRNISRRARPFGRFRSELYKLGEARFKETRSDFTENNDMRMRSEERKLRLETDAWLTSAGDVAQRRGGRVMLGGEPSRYECGYADLFDASSLFGRGERAVRPIDVLRTLDKHVLKVEVLKEKAVFTKKEKREAKGKMRAAKYGFPKSEDEVDDFDPNGQEVQEEGVNLATRAVCLSKGCVCGE